MRISDWSSAVCSSDLDSIVCPPRTSLRRPVPSRNRGGIIVPLKAHIGAAVPIGLAKDRRLAEDSGDAHRRRSSTSRQRSEEHTSELQSLMRISYAVFCLKKKKQHNDLT